jgi:hypothetical protein
LDVCRPSANYSTSIDGIDRRRFEALRGSTSIDRVTENGKAADDGNREGCYGEAAGAQLRFKALF